MQPTPVIQFGTSRFLQAHAALFISDAMERGQDAGPITVVQTTADPTRARRLRGLVGAYPVRIEGMEGGHPMRETVTVRSVTRALSTAGDWSEVCRVFVHEARIVLSNTADAGFAPSEHDTAPGYSQRMSYPAKLTHLLRLRFIAGGAPIQIMPTELVSRNGDTLRRRVLEIAGERDRAFRRYLEEGVVWVNSLVDRIVSQPLEPAGAVAEPYALWAIEDRPGLIAPCAHPAIRIVPSLAEIEALKLYVLNLGHTVLADRWLAEGGGGDVLVRHLIADPDERARLCAVLEGEVRPAFAAAGLGERFDDYLTTTLERFANPFLDHRLADIAENHAQKIERRILALMRWGAGQGDTSDKPVLRAIAAPLGEMA